MRIIFCVTLLFSLFGFSQNNVGGSPKEMVQVFCGACHVTPEPSQLPKRLWEKNILPEMGSFYGIQQQGFGLLKKRKPEDLEVIRSLNIYPETQTISDETWQLIKDYYITNAPESIPIPKERKNRTKNLKNFKGATQEMSVISKKVYDFMMH